MSYLNELEIGKLTVDTLIGGGKLQGKGDEYWLDPTNGSDGNSGKAPDDAKSSLADAYALLTDAQNDILYYIPGSTSISVASGGLTWEKSYTHFIGLGAWSGVGQRARMFATSTNTDASMVTVSGSGCLFQGLMMHYGVDSAAAKYCLTVTGARNLFKNCSIKGIGHNTQDVADAASLFLNGAEENKFIDCHIGLDTIGRGTAVNTEIFVDGGAVRNNFENCELVAWLDADTHTFLDFNDTTSNDRWMAFRRCMFLAESTNNATAMASAITLPASHQTTYVVLDHCAGVNITDWEANNRGQVFCIGPDGGTAGTGCNIATKVA